MVNNKSRLVFFVLLLLIFVYIPTKSIAADNTKVGVVNLNRAGQESKRGREIVQEMKRKLKKEQGIIAKKEDKVKALRKDLSKQGLIMSEELKRKKEAAFRSEYRNLNRHIKDAEEEIKISQREAMNKILTELVEITRAIGEKDGYTFITTKESVVYYDKTIDITDKVIREYNRRYRNKKSSN